MGQRERLYDAEDAIGFEGFYTTVEAAQMVVDKILRTKWWRQRSRVRFVRVVYPAEGMSGAFPEDDTHWKIEFSPARLCEISLMHEMTHVLVGVTKGNSPAHHERDHGPKYAGALLAVWRRFLSARLAKALQDEFDERKVKYAEFQ